MPIARRTIFASWQNAFVSYVDLQPVGLVNAIRLYLGIAASILARIFAREVKPVGFYVPGKSTLVVSLHGTVAKIRPKTNDLAIFAATTEPLTATWFSVKKGDVVVDIGAHIGRYTLIAAKRASKVIAVEPSPSNFSILEDNVRRNRLSNVTMIPLAMSDHRGRLFLQLAEAGNTGTWTVTSQQGVNDATRDHIRVECDTVDNIVWNAGLEKIDWLKIDVEGHEVEVLGGAMTSLTKTRYLLLEVADLNVGLCRQILTSKGFRLKAVEKGGGPTCNWFLVREDQI